ncbi:hypothetical protein [Chitinophaga sancti]|uniref:Uncharacterized protein n=1 Tax=Chitinophaga sancti TaxID=1004 RepID=A0ABZ0XQX8_9BACT|nr:hypothetical protein [Chitinophaga sancti]WQD61803.1 hypothetical protein U0033_28375 [Chitinophaga sancti]WQG92628.1 hypothetical protein SR876_14010 [Chitinophaga sancti]
MLRSVGKQNLEFIHYAASNPYPGISFRILQATLTWNFIHYAAGNPYPGISFSVNR